MFSSTRLGFHGRVLSDFGNTSPGVGIDGGKAQDIAIRGPISVLLGSKSYNIPFIAWITD